MSDIAQPIVEYAKGRILREGWPVVLTTYTGSGPGQKPA